MHVWRAPGAFRVVLFLALGSAGCAPAKPPAPESMAPTAHPERTLDAWAVQLEFGAGERAAVANAVDLYLTRIGLVARDLGSHDPISLAPLETSASQLADHTREDFATVLSAEALARFDRNRERFRTQALEDLINTLVDQARHAHPAPEFPGMDPDRGPPQRGGRGGGRGGPGRGGGGP